MNESGKSPKIGIVIVDDSELVRVGLRTLLKGVSAISVLGESGTVKGTAELCRQTGADLALLDIRLPDGTGFDACRQILAQSPGTRVLILTSVVDDSLLDEAIRAGAHGYLLKEIDGRGLVQAISDVAAGRSILDPAVTARVMQLVKTRAESGQDTPALNSLSPQERRVLALIAAGRTNKEVASEMGLSDKTVKNYLSNIFEKLNVTRRAQAAAIFAQDQARS